MIAVCAMSDSAAVSCAQPAETDRFNAKTGRNVPIWPLSLVDDQGTSGWKRRGAFAPIIRGVAMYRTEPFHSRNILLNALSEEDRGLLTPHFERVPLEREMVLVAADEPIAHVYFPESGIASIVSLSVEGDRTEVGIFGREGVSGTSLLLGADRSPHETFIQVDHAHALRISAAMFMEAVESSATLQRVMLCYVQTLFIQTSQSTWRTPATRSRRDWPAGCSCVATATTATTSPSPTSSWRSWWARSAAA